MKITIFLVGLVVCANCTSHPEVVPVQRSKPVRMIGQDGRAIDLRDAFLKGVPTSTSLRPEMFQALWIAWKFRIEKERSKLMPSEVDFKSFVFAVEMPETLGPIKVSMSPLPAEGSGAEEIGFHSTSLGFPACYLVDTAKGTVLKASRPCRD